ncbi:cytochrome P450 76M5-like [Carex rostrata]
MELTLSFLLIALTIFLLSTLSKLFSSSHNCNALLPPGPTPLPIIGNLLALDDQPHRKFAHFAKVYGPIFSLKLGLTTTIVVSSPKVAREVLQTKDEFFSARSVPDLMRACNQHNEVMTFLPSTSPQWKRDRAICATNLFSVRSLERTREIRAQKARDITNIFCKKAGYPLCIGDLLFSGMLNMVSNVLFSQDVIDINCDSGQEFTELIKETINEVGKPNVSDFFPFLRFLDLQRIRHNGAGHYRRYCKFFDVIIEARLQYRTSNGKNYGDLLDSLLDMVAESNITRREIPILLMELIGAGSDNISITVEWVMAELLHDPVAMARAQAEVRQVFSSQTLEEQDIVNLPYLQAVIKEAMRLHPAVPILPHKAMKDGVDLGGYIVPKGATVFVNTWAIGHNSQVWNEPDVFRPERFLEKQSGFHGKECDFLPFGSGRKSCPGLPFVVKVIPYLLALMLAEFDWRLPDGMEHKDVDLTEKFTVGLKMAVPLSVVPVPVNI